MLRRQARATAHWPLWRGAWPLALCAILALTVAAAACSDNDPNDTLQADQSQTTAADQSGAVQTDQVDKADSLQGDPHGSQPQGDAERAIGTAEAQGDPPDSPSQSASAEPGFRVDGGTTWREVYERLLGAGERSCIRDVVAAAELESILGRPVASEGDTEPWEVAIFRCLEPATARAIFLSLMLTSLEEEQPGLMLTPAEESCLRAWVADLEVADLIAASAASDAAGFATLYEQLDEVFTCVPRMFVFSLLGEAGAHAELSEAESACLIEWSAELDWATLLPRMEAGEVAVLGEFISGLTGCLPDLFVSLILADSGFEPEDLSEAEQTCLREWFAGLDWADLVSAAEEDIFALANIGLALHECAPELVDSLNPGIERSRAVSDIPDDHSDVIEQATPAAIGVAASGQVESAGDADYFVFQAEAGLMYQIDVELGTLLDSVAVLYGTEGWELARNDDRDDSTASRIFWQAESSGPLYIEVTGYDEHTGSYRLTLSEPDFTDDHADGVERATPVVVGAQIDGSLQYAGDIDYFVFEAEAVQLYQIDVTLGTLTDSLATLYDNTEGWPLTSNDDHGRSTASRIYWEATDSVPHYVEVSGFGDRTGTYTLTVVKR